MYTYVHVESFFQNCFSANKSLLHPKSHQLRHFLTAQCCVDRLSKTLLVSTITCFCAMDRSVHLFVNNFTPCRELRNLISEERRQTEEEIRLAEEMEIEKELIEKRTQIVLKTIVSLSNCYNGHCINMINAFIVYHD